MEFRPAPSVRGRPQKSIGNFHKNEQRPFLQGLAFRNKILCVVIVKHIFNQCAFFLRCAVEVENHILFNVNVGKRQIERFTKVLDCFGFGRLYSCFNFPKFVLACLFLCPLNTEHADEVTSTDNHDFQPQGQVANGVDHNHGVKSVGYRINDCGDRFAAFNSGKALDCLNDNIDNVKSDEDNQKFSIHSINSFLTFCNNYNIILIICQ